MAESGFDKRLKSIPASDILKQAPDGKLRAGGAEIGAEDFHMKIAGQELIYAGPSRYAGVVQGRPGTNSQGRPIIVTVR